MTRWQTSIEIEPYYRFLLFYVSHFKMIVRGRRKQSAVDKPIILKKKKKTRRFPESWTCEIV